MKTLSTLLIAIFLLLFSACQESATGNKDLADSIAEASLKYPLKTGQVSTFTYTDTQTNSDYFDDGYYKNRKGYERSFIRRDDGTVYNTNYNLYWQDANITQEYNLTTAEDYCSNLVLGGKSDWRLPNVFELTTLLDLESRTGIRESSFNNMPPGFYFSSQDVIGTTKTIVVYFGETDFNITKIIKEYDVIDVNASEYGILYGTTTVPTYHVPNADDPFYYISKVVESDLYYNTDTGFQTVVSTDTSFDSDGNITIVFGPYVASTGGTQFDPIVTANPVASQVKCVSGSEIKGFDFVRDDRNELVLDRATNLVWQDDKDVVLNKHTWGESIQYCSKLTLGGYNDWRLPTISEMITLVDFSYSGTFSVSNAFLNKAACRFHSSSDICHTATCSVTSCNGVSCHQGNYQLDTCGYLNDKVVLNTSMPVDEYTPNLDEFGGVLAEIRYKTRCVRAGAY